MASNESQGKRSFFMQPRFVMPVLAASLLVGGAFLYMNTSLTILCMLKARKMVSQSGIDLFKEMILTDDDQNLPGFIQARSESKSQGCSL